MKHVNKAKQEDKKKNQIKNGLGVDQKTLVELKAAAPVQACCSEVDNALDLSRTQNIGHMLKTHFKSKYPNLNHLRLYFQMTDSCAPPWPTGCLCREGHQPPVTCGRCQGPRYEASNLHHEGPGDCQSASQSCEKHREDDT